MLMPVSPAWVFPTLKKVFFNSSRFYSLARIILGSVFIWAGGVKLVAPRAFARIVSAYALVPDVLLVPVAIGLPAIELLAGIALVFDVRGSLKVVSGLLMMFLMVLGYGILKNTDVDCGCFTTQEIHARAALWIAFLRDLGLLSIAFYLFLWRWVRKRSEMRTQDSLHGNLSGEGIRW
jgi:hypothetical protein